MFRYEINFWDENTQEPTFEKGICSGSDYSEAAAKVVEYYGKENVVDIKLYELESILTDEDISITCTD